VAGNLSRNEATARAAALRVTSYEVELDLHGSETSFGSTATVRFDCTSPGMNTFIDLSALAVRELTLNGAPLPLSAFAGDRRPRVGAAANARHHD